MKKLLSICICFIYISFPVAAQRQWQQISDLKLKNIAGDFKSPPPEYGMILWWGWDGPVTDSVIRLDLDRIKAMGFRGVMIEAGYGMTAQYLSDEWFSLVKTAVGEAKKRGMRVWIEDEGKYPSGFAGGKFSKERPDLKMQGLVITEKINVEPAAKVSRKLPDYTLSAVAFNRNDSTIQLIDISSGELNWQAPEGSWQVFLAGHRFRSSVTRSVNNLTRGKDTTASLMDYLNPLATRQFIEWTHEQYKKYFGDEFGKTFMGLMGDEPDFAYTPWTPKILEEFKARKDYDIKPYLASFFVPQLSEEAKRMKADYWDVWSDLFRDNFFDIQAEWCSKNNIEYIVHLNHEDQLPGLIKSSGDYFKNMRNVAVPGVDAIWSQIWMDHVADYPKLASSASHLYGKPRAFTESFAAYTYRPSVQQAKWVLDYQLARGINSIQVMFMSASTSGKPVLAYASSTPGGTAIQAAQARSFFLSDSFPGVSKYFNRATYLLSQGRPAAQTAVYFPTMSMWYGDNESNISLLEVSKTLLENQFDFDFVDEQALISLLNPVKGKLISSYGAAYNSIIVPAISVISENSLKKLSEFAATGGKVIFLGRIPVLVEGKNFRDASQKEDLSWAYVENSGKLTPSILATLPESDFKAGQPIPQVKYQHRLLKNADLYFIFNESKDPVSFNLSLSGIGNAEIWDAATGNISALKRATQDQGRIRTPLTLGGWETKFIVIKR